MPPHTQNRIFGSLWNDGPRHPSGYSIASSNCATMIFAMSATG